MVHFLSQLVVDSGPEPATQTEIWLRWSIQFGVMVTGLVGAVTVLSKALRATDKKIEEVREEAAKASKFSEPTGNGFAAGVKASLARIEDRQENLEVGLQRVETRLDRHIDKGN